MSRTHLVLIATLAGVLAFATEAQAGKKLYVGNLPFSPADQVGIFDRSTSPASEMLDVRISLNGAHIDNMQTPGAALPSSSSLGIVNPGPDGLGDAAFFDVFYTGAPGDFPANSFFDVFTEISPPSPLPPDNAQGSLNELTGSNGDLVRGMDFDVEIAGLSVGGVARYSLNLSWEINPNQPGLRFTDLSVAPLTVGRQFDNFAGLSLDPGSVINPAESLFRVTLTSQSVPEPSTIVLAAVGVAVLMGVARKRRLQTV